MITKDVNKRVERTDIFRSFSSEYYNWILNEQTGAFERWGKHKEDDPLFSPFGPELVDMEISTICSGPTGTTPCKHCYKSNTSVGKNMPFETFKRIFDKLPHTVGQIAFGIGDIDGNPDLWQIMWYCRENDYNPNVAPNITINGARLTDHSAGLLAEFCGAMAVSNYGADICYPAVQMMTDKGMKQVNIHQILSVETFDTCIQLMRDSKEDPRLKNLNAIVFLLLKPKGKRNNLTPLTDLNKWKELSQFAFDNNIRIGFDSCSSPWFLDAIADHPFFKRIAISVEPCESSCFSAYINVDGFFVPCSFCEDVLDGWDEGLSVLGCNDFMTDIWFNEKTVLFRKALLEKKKSGDFHCPVFAI